MHKSPSLPPPLKCASISVSTAYCKYVLHSHKCAWLGANSSQAVGLPYVVIVLYFVIMSQAHFFLKR